MNMKMENFNEMNWDEKCCFLQRLQCTWVIFKKMKTLCDIEGEISNWTN